MRRITSRFVLLIASAAMAPLVLYGADLDFQPENGNRIDGQRGQSSRSPIRSSEQIGQYIAHNTRVLKSVGLELAQHQPGAVAAVARAEGLRHRLSGVPRDHVLRRRRPCHRDEPRWRCHACRSRTRRTVGSADGLHRPAAARRGQPAPHDDCGASHARRPGAGLGGRRDCPRVSLADGRSRARRHRGICAACRGGAAPDRPRQSQQEAARRRQRRTWHPQERRSSSLRRWSSSSQDDSR